MHVTSPPAVSIFTPHEEVCKAFFKTKQKTKKKTLKTISSQVVKYGGLGTCSDRCDTVRAFDSGTSLSDSGERSCR